LSGESGYPPLARLAGIAAAPGMIAAIAMLRVACTGETFGLAWQEPGNPAGRNRGALRQPARQHRPPAA